MFIDGRSVADGTEVECDICVVGAGVAGVTIARELSGGSQNVCLVESGGLQHDTETQALYKGSNTGYPYYDLDVLRLRYFGGSGNHWGGVCRPLDEIDFSYRDWIPDSGWPIDRADLDPYYAKAHEVCRLGDYAYSVDELETPGSSRLAFDAQLVESTVFRHSSTTPFGAIYQEEIKSAKNIHAYLHSNVLEFETNVEGSSVTRIEVGTLHGSRFGVRSKIFILATGAIENARLMLTSDTTAKYGIGNDYGHVGRNFMEHVSMVGAMFMPWESENSLDIYAYNENHNGIAALTIPAEIQQEQETLNICANLVPSSIAAGLKSVAPGIVASVIELRTDRSWKNLGKHIKRISSNLDDVALHSYRQIFRARSSDRQYQLVYQMEQAPNPESRVTLGADKDALGMRRSEVKWAFGELERNTLRKTNEIIAKAAGKAALGRLWEVPDAGDSGWPPGVRGAWHQMGTTRMSRDPKKGVVDMNCKVHGLANLYVAGSSVFPTSGCSGPTLSIVALALRLANFVSDNLRIG